MKRTAILLALTCFMWGCATSGGKYFYLRDPETGAQSGPYTYRHGEKVRLGDSTLLISRIVSAEQMTADRTESIIIPEVAFKNLPVEDAIEQLSILSAENDPDRTRRRGIPIVYMTFHTHEASTPPSITLSATDISVRECLNLINTLSNGMKWAIINELIVYGWANDIPDHAVFAGNLSNKALDATSQ